MAQAHRGAIASIAVGIPNSGTLLMSWLTHEPLNQTGL